MSHGSWPRYGGVVFSAAWIQTYLGLALDLDAPRVEQIEIEDVAHALSLQCRFTGHCAWHYSVAQHCVHVAELVRATDETQALAALLHEVGEAYVGDWSSPLKWLLRTLAPAALGVDALITARAEERFGLAPGATKTRLIKHADLIMLATEKRDLFGPVPRQGWGASTGFVLPAPLDTHVQEWTPREAKARFLDAFERYGGAW